MHDNCSKWVEHRVEFATLPQTNHPHLALPFLPCPIIFVLFLLNLLLPVSVLLVLRCDCLVASTASCLFRPTLLSPGLQLNERSDHPSEHEDGFHLVL